MDMVYRSEGENGLSNSFLLGTASRGCWHQQSNSAYSRDCTEGGMSVRKCIRERDASRLKQKKVLVPFSNENLFSKKAKQNRIFP